MPKKGLLDKSSAARLTSEVMTLDSVPVSELSDSFTELHAATPRTMKGNSHYAPALLQVAAPLAFLCLPEQRQRAYSTGDCTHQQVVRRLQCSDRQGGMCGISRLHPHGE